VVKENWSAIARPLNRPVLVWCTVGILGLAVVVAYHNTFRVPFLLDDLFSIIDNESVHHIGAWWAALLPRAQVFTAGRPLLNLSYALNYAAGGFSVSGYHVVNLLIHFAAAMTLWGILRHTIAWRSLSAREKQKGEHIALVAALVWAIHPLQTVCVTYISQRAESLMGLFYLLTVYCFIRTVETPILRWRVLTVICCLAGMLVKEVMVTAPLIVFLFDYTFVSGSFRGAWRERKNLHLSLAATWVVLLALMLGTRVAERGIGYRFSYSWFDYVRVESNAVSHYLRLAFWPFPLVFDYGQESPVPSLLRFFTNLGLIGALIAAIVFALRRRSWMGFLGCWFFLILAPTSSLVPVAGQPIAENRVYLPAAAIAVLISTSQYLAGRRVLIASCAGIMALTLLTVVRNRDYQSEISIWADTAAKRPDSSRAHLNYGGALMRAKHAEEGIRQLEISVRLNPNYAAAHSNLACAYFEQRRYEDAFRHFQISIATDPTDPMTYSNYGAALFQVGRAQESLEQLMTALRIRPAHAASRVNAGVVLARVGRPAEAIAMFEETLRMYPNDTAARDNHAQLRAAIQSGTYKPNAATP
jgi:Tfp pilus assembly protein PilF